MLACSLADSSQIYELVDEQSSICPHVRPGTHTGRRGAQVFLRVVGLFNSRCSLAECDAGGTFSVTVYVKQSVSVVNGSDLLNRRVFLKAKCWFSVIRGDNFLSFGKAGEPIQSVAEEEQQFEPTPYSGDWDNPRYWSCFKFPVHFSELPSDDSSVMLGIDVFTGYNLGKFNKEPITCRIRLDVSRLSHVNAGGSAVDVQRELGNQKGTRDRVDGILGLVRTKQLVLVRLYTAESDFVRKYNSAVERFRLSANNWSVVDLDKLESCLDVAADKSSFEAVLRLLESGS